MFLRIHVADAKFDRLLVVGTCGARYLQDRLVFGQPKQSSAPRDQIIEVKVRDDVPTCFGETSEITGAEQVCASRAKTPEVVKKFTDTWQAYMDEVIEPYKTSDLLESRPTKGNIEGGLTAIEEKAFGNLETIGNNTRYIDVLTPAEQPSKGPGLYCMDTSSAAAECVTLQAAGFVVHLFPTGQGNIIGNPIEPVIELAGNPRTVRTMSKHLDLDVSGLLRREMNLDEAGDQCHP